MFDPHRITVETERVLAERLCGSIKRYWLELGYDIVVWMDLPIRSRDIADHYRAPIFPIRSNIGPYGYPPKRDAA